MGSLPSNWMSSGSAVSDRRAAATFDLGDLPAVRYVARVELGDESVRLEATHAFELPAPGAP